MADQSSIFPTAADLSFGMGETPLVPPSVPVPTVPTQSIPDQKREQVGSVSDQKRDAVASRSEAVRALMGGDEERQRLAMAIEEGNDLGQSEMAQVLARGNTAEILALYGPEALEQAPDLWRTMRRTEWTRNESRDLDQIAGDAALGAGAGLVAGAGGLAALGGGLLSDDLGGFVADVTNRATDGIRSAQSEELQDQRELGAVRQALEAEDNDRQYERDLEDGKSFAGLRRFGREVMDQAGEYWDNPVLAGDLAAEGVGSVLLGGGIAKAINVGARGMPLIIGALEGGGSYTGIQAEIMALSAEDLSEGSSEYRRLRAEGMDHEEAQVRLANRAGLTGAALSTVLGAVSGKLVAKFEANPLGSLLDEAGDRGIVPALRAFGRETLAQSVEEGAQGAGQTLFSNIAMRQYADEDADLFEGIGQDLVSGAVAGAGMVAGLQGPRVPIEGMAQIGRAVGTMVEPVTDAASRLATAVTTRQETNNDAVSPVGAPAVAQAVADLATWAQGVTTQAVAQVEAATASGDTAAVERAQNVAQQARDTILITGKEANAYPAAVRDLFAPPGETLPVAMVVPRQAALNEVIKALNGKDLDPETRVAAELWLASQLDLYQTVMEQDTSGLDEKTTESLRGGMESLNTILGSKAAVAAVERAETITSADVGATAEKIQITDENASSPQVQAAAAQTAAIAMRNPAGIDPAFARMVLDHSTKGGLSEQQQKTVQAAAVLAETSMAAAERKAATKGLGKEDAKNIFTVSHEINTKGGKVKYKQHSVAQHQKEVVQAISQGNIDIANEAMNRLRNFGETLQNKLEAGRKSALLPINQNAVPYRTWTGKKWIEATNKDAGTFYTFKGSANNLKTFEAVREDAAGVAEVYNTLLELFGGNGLQGKPLEENLADVDRMPAPKARALAESRPKAEKPPAKPKTPNTPPPPSTTPTTPANRVVKLAFNAKAPEGVVNTHRSGKSNLSNTKAGEPGWLGNPYNVAKGQFKTGDASYLYAIALIQKMAGSESFFNAIKALNDKKLGYYKPELTLSHATMLNRLVTIANSESFDDFKKKVDERVKPNFDKLVEERAIAEGNRLLKTEQAPAQEGEPDGNDSTGEEGQGNSQSESQEGSGSEGDDQNGTGEGEDVGGNGGEGTPPGGTGTGAGTGGARVSAGDLKTAREIIKAVRQTLKDARKALRETRKVQKTLWKYDSKSKLPLISTLIKTRKIDPKSEVGRELYALGVTAKTNPGLFKNGGATALDNLVVSEWEEALPGIREATGTERDETYLDLNGVLNLIQDESRGNSAWLETRQQAEMYDAVIVEYEATVDALEDQLEVLENDYRAKAGKGQRGSGTPPGNRGASGRPKGGSEGTTESEGGTDDNAGEGEGTSVEDEVLEDGDELDGEEYFNHLPKNKRGVNWFVQAYRFIVGRSKFTMDEAPARTVIEALKEIKGGKKLTPYKMNDSQVNAWNRLLRNEGVEIINKMNARLKTRMENLKAQPKVLEEEDREWMTPLEALDVGMGKVPGDTRDFLSFRETMGLNIVDPETGQYEKGLAQAIMLASLHWVLNSSNSSKLEDEQIAKIFQVDISEIDEDMRDKAQKGINPKQAAEGLARTIMDFWGASRNTKVPKNYVEGVAGNLAMEAIIAMKGVLVDELTITVDFAYEDDAGVAKKKENSMIAIDVAPKAVKEKTEGVRGAKTFLTDAFVPSVAKKISFGKPFEEVVETQTNRAVKLGNKIKAALGNHNKVAAKRNRPFMDLANAMGQERMMRIMGHRVVNPEKANIVDLVSIEGKNSSVEYSWNNVQEIDAQLEGYALGNQVNNPDDVRIYFSWFVASNERIHGEDFTGQADKFMRQAFPPTWTTLDLRGVEGDAHDRFWITVAQAVGVKTEKATRDENVVEARKRVQKNYTQSMEILKDFEVGGRKELTEEQKDTIEAEITVSAQGLDKVNRALVLNNINKVMDALLAAARYELLMELTAANPEDTRRAEFAHSLPLEADGKTNGPINLIAHFTRRFSQHYLKTVAKGGYFLGQGARSDGSLKTLNEQYDKDKGDRADLYEETGTLATKLLAKQIKRLRGSSETVEIGNALERMLNRFANVEIKDGQLIISRHNSKNPVTVVGYGAGGRGIAGKIVGAMLDNLYAELTEVGQLEDDLGSIEALEIAGIEQLMADLKTLTEARAMYTRQSGWHRVWETNNGAKPGKLYDLKKYRTFKLTAVQRQMLGENIKVGMVNPLVQAIKETMGKEVLETMSHFQQATNLMSGMLIVNFRAEIAKELSVQRARGARVLELRDQPESAANTKEIAELLKAGAIRQTEFLTDEGYEKVYKEMRKFGAVIAPVNTRDQEVDLSTKESTRTPEDSRDFMRGMDGEHTGLNGIQAPRMAGVSVQPLLTISRGDARMMVNLFAREDAESLGLDRSLPVFDGLEMPADMIEVLSEAANQAVLESWMENPAKDLYDSYVDWMRQSPENIVESIQDIKGFVKMLKLGDAIFEAEPEFWSKPAKRQTEVLKEVVIDQMKIHRRRLGGIALDIEARKAVERMVESTTDQMASGESPHLHDGLKKPEGMDMLQWFEELFEVEFARLVKEAEESKLPEKAAVEAPNASLAEAMDFHGKREAFMGTGGEVKKLTVKQMMKAARAADLKPEQARLFQELARVMPDFTFMVGKQGALNQLRKARYPIEGDPRGEPMDLGRTEFSDGIIWIANASGETVLHEMMHAALGAVVTEHYSGVRTLNKEMRDVREGAFKNLESLMKQFLSMSFAFEDTGTRLAAEAAQNEILHHIDDFAMMEESLEGLSEQAYTFMVMRRSAAMMEFISWTLTNQNLASALKRSKTQGRMKTLISKVLQGIRTIFGLNKDQSLDMFSNIAWNSGALLRTLEDAVGANDALAGMSLDQTMGQFSNPMMKQIRQKFEARLFAYLRQTDPVKRTADWREARVLGRDALNRVEAAGWTLTNEEASTFRSMQAAMATAMKVSPSKMTQVQRIFSAVLRDLTPERLMEDESSTDPQELDLAQRRFEALVGKSAPETDMEGRSNLLVTMVALSMVHPDMRRTLERMKMPKMTEIDTSSTDALLESTADRIIEVLSAGLANGPGLAAGSTVLEAMDKLVLNLAEVEKDDRYMLERYVEDLTLSGDGHAKARMAQFGNAVEALGRKIKTKPQSLNSIRDLGTTMIGEVMTKVGQMLDENRAEVLAESTLRYGNLMDFKWFTEPMKNLASDMIGITNENVDLMMMVNVVKTQVAQFRQTFRNKMPVFLAQQFKQKLKAPALKALHEVFGQLDIASLEGIMSIDQIRAIFTDKQALGKALRTAADDIDAMAPSVSRKGREFTAKADELALYMATGVVALDNHSLATNAYSIANLNGTTRRVGGEPDAELVAAIDQYTTLKALEIYRKTNQEGWARVVQVAQNEEKGLGFITKVLHALHEKERERAENNPAARINGWKGHIPSEIPEGASLRVAEDGKHNELLALGYKRMGTYDSGGLQTGKRSYYYSSTGGKATYLQGLVQTVENSVMGVDPLTGRTVTGIMGGLITGKEVSLVHQRIKHGLGNGKAEPLRPIFDDDGFVVAYERLMKPEMLKSLNQNQDILKAIGIWFGRQQEETLGQSINESVVDKIKENWDDGDAKGFAKTYTNMADPKQEDPVLVEAWKMIPRETKVYIENVFGPDTFMVRKDMAKDLVGYRLPSIKDMWTGETRMPEQAQNAIRGMISAVLGNKSIPVLVTAEKGTQAVVSFAKSSIVVRSIIVPMMNAASNVVQLKSMGVAWRAITESSPAKMIEITSYLKNQEREVEITALLARYKDDKRQVLKLEAERKGLDDANRRMSIWPLIESGQFSTITEGETEVDAAIQNGKWAEYIKNIAEAVPTRLGTFGRYGFMTQDTALFKGMARATQYGDFIARSILYDHLVKDGKKTKKEALRKVTEAFVAYNFLPGRVRSYTDAMGITWFWPYKIKIMKQALNMVRDNPVSALVMSVSGGFIPDIPGVSVGSPFSDNMANVIADGRFGNSVGWGMLSMVPGTLPISNVIP